MPVLSHADLLALPEAADCPRKDNPRYLADCIVRKLLADPSCFHLSPLTAAGFSVRAGIGRLQIINGQPHFTPATPPTKLKPTGLGDLIERAIKPIAKTLKLPCLNPDGALKPNSPCAQRRNYLNARAPFKRF